MPTTSLATVSRFAAVLGLALIGLGMAQDRELVVAHGIDIPGFDVHDHNTTAVEAVHINVFDYLIMRDTDGDFQPALATSWEAVDESTWRLTLRPDVLWHDGAPFTAADVEFTLERAANDSSLTEHSRYSVISDVEIVDDLEVLISTTESDPLMLNRLSRISSSMLPKQYIEDVGWEEFSVNPIGTGPFEFVEWQRDDRVVFQAFDDHWRGRPDWDRLVFRTIPENSTRVSELITGGVDIAVNIPAHDIERIERSGEASVASAPTPRVMLLVLNTEDGVATGDPRVREAIDYAIDKQLLVETLMGGFGTPTRSRVTPGISGAPLDLYGASVYDPERARSLLEEAGYGPGDLRLSIQSPSGRYPMDAETAELVGVMLNQVGIETEFTALEWSAFLDRVWSSSGRVENIALIALGNSMSDGWLALSPFTCTGTSAHRSNWCNEEFDALVNAAETEVDIERRNELLHEAFYIALEERPFIGLFQLSDVVGISNDLDWAPRQDELLWAFDVKPVNDD